MNNENFENVIKTRLNKCIELLGSKAGEYAMDADRLHNFKVAAKLQSCTPISALAGMMAKHTVSVYDLIKKYENGQAIPREMWAEKIGDHINYLLLLTALVAEEANERTQGVCEVAIDSDKLFNILTREDKKEVTAEYLDGIDFARTTLLELPPVNQWISAKEKLPDKQGDYIVYLQCKGLKATVSVAFYMKDLGFIRSAVKCGDVVTHWQPLPEPPESEGKNDL